MIEELCVFLQLGCKLDGHPHVLHGGVTCLVLNEFSSLLLAFNTASASYPAREHPVTARLKRFLFQANPDTGSHFDDRETQGDSRTQEVH
jgi:hypothetical protein